MRKFLRLLLTLLLLALTAIMGFAVWSYRVNGTLPFQLPGVPTPVLYTPTPTVTPTPTPTPIMGKAVVASRAIARGEKFSEANLRIAAIPQAEIPDGALTDPRKIYGLLAREPIPAGTVITTDMGAPTGHILGSGSFTAQLLQPGQVAIAYPITGPLSAVGYAPRAGDVVDIIVTFLFTDLDLRFQSRLSDRVLVLTENLKTNSYAFIPAAEIGRLAKEDPVLAVPVYVIPNGKQRPRMVAQMAIRGARVLYFGHDLWPTTPAPTPASTPRTGKKPTPTPAPSKPDVMVLALSPQDALVLNFFMARQAITTLTLHSAFSQGQTPKTVPVTLDYIIQHFGVPVPAPLPYQIQGKNP